MAATGGIARMKVALGLKAHTGWAALVVLANSDDPASERPR